MMQSDTLSSAEQLQQALARYSEESKPVFAYFFADWCPDCQAASPVVRAAFKDDAFASPLIQVMVGERAAWKTPSNEFRQAPSNVSNIPTLVKMRKGKEIERLVEGELLDTSTLEEFLQ